MKARRQKSSKAAAYPRDMVGYGKRLPDPKWPQQARLALQIRSTTRPAASSTCCTATACRKRCSPTSDFRRSRARAAAGGILVRVGSRRGVWRLLRLFEERKIVVGILAVATALARDREVAAAMVEAGHEIVSHHYRSIDYQRVPIWSSAGTCGLPSRRSRRSPACGPSAG